MEAAYNFYETKMNQIVVDGGPALDINTLAARQLECFNEAIKVVCKNVWLLVYVLGLLSFSSYCVLIEIRSKVFMEKTFFFRILS